MEKWRFERCRETLKKYPSMAQHIQQIEEEIRHPYRQLDVNSDIKGNGKNTDAMFNTLWRIENEKAISQLKASQAIIEDMLEECGNDTETIIRELYIRKYPEYTMQGLVKNLKVSCGRNKAIELRNKFFCELDKKLNNI